MEFRCELKSYFKVRIVQLAKDVAFPAGIYDFRIEREADETQCYIKDGAGTWFLITCDTMPCEPPLPAGG